jgi:hypothetical protein
VQRKQPSLLFDYVTKLQLKIYLAKSYRVVILQTGEHIYVEVPYLDKANLKSHDYLCDNAPLPI